MNNDYLNLDLELGATLSKSLVASVNHLCDRAEDAGANGVVLITLRCVPGAAREPVQVSLVNQWERALRRLERLPLLTLAAVDGVCNGLGLALLLATDYRVVTQRLRLSLALDGQEILPGMVLHRLATQIGAAHARRMALFGTELDAQAALEYGLADAVSGEPAASAARFAASLGASLLNGLPVRRRLVLEAAAVSYEDSLGTYLAACDRMLRAGAARTAPPQPDASSEAVAIAA